MCIRDRLSTDRLPAQLAAEPLRPIYLVAGSEALLVLEAADAVRVAARKHGISEREVHDMDGRDADWDCLLYTSIICAELMRTRRKPSAAG